MQMSKNVNNDVSMNPPIRGNENQWFKSYLSNRKQKVFVNGVESNCLLVNSIRSTIRVDPRSVSLRLFVDDHFFNSNWERPRCIASKDINSEILLVIHEWLCSNRLTTNLSRTKYLIFQPRQKINSNLYPPLKLADQYLEQS